MIRRLNTRLAIKSCALAIMPAYDLSTIYAKMDSHHHPANIEAEQIAAKTSNRLRPRLLATDERVVDKNYSYSTEEVLRCDPDKLKETRTFYRRIFGTSLAILGVTSIGLLYRRNWVAAGFVVPLTAIIAKNNYLDFDMALITVKLNASHDMITIQRGLLSTVTENIPINSLVPSEENQTGTTILKFKGKTIEQDQTSKSTSLQLELEDFKTHLLETENRDFLIDVLSGNIAEMQKYKKVDYPVKVEPKI